MSKLLRKTLLLIASLLILITGILAMSTFTPTYAATIDESGAISIKNESQVRLDDATTETEDETGMRFFVDVDLQKMSTILAQYPDYEVEYGVAMLPTKYLGGAELNVDGTYSVSLLQIPLTQGATTSGVKTYKAVLTDIPSLSYETEVTARAYAKLTKENADTVYIQSSTSTARSIGQVATAFYLDKDAIDPEEEPLYKALLEKNLGTVSFDEESYYIFMNEKSSKDFSTEYKVYGNKYGFELDSAYLTANNAEISYVTDNVVDVADGVITALGRGTTDVSLTVGTKTATTSVEVETTADLAETLGTYELASFDHKGYETMVEAVADTTTNIHEVSVGDYFGKTGVIKIAGETDGGMSLVKIDLPVALSAGSTITMQMYVKYGAVGGGLLGLSASSTGVAWGSPVTSQDKSMETWEIFVITAPLADSLYFIMSVTGVTFEYYISSIMVGDQTLKPIKDELAPTLEGTEIARFDDERYLQLISYGVNLNESNTTATIVDDPLDVSETPRKVLKVAGSNANGWGKVYINLPKAISESFTMEYRMVGSSDGAGSIWSIMDASEGWGTWIDAYGDENTPWTTLTNANWAGQEKFVVGLNQMAPFELYIAVVNNNLTAAEQKEYLASKLGDDKLAEFNEDMYLNLIGSTFYNESLTALLPVATQIVEDELDTNATRRKVLKISNGEVPARYFGTLHINLPKTITSSFTLEYRTECEFDDGYGSYMSVVNGTVAGWDYATPLNYNTDGWQTITIDSYAGQSAFNIYVNTSIVSFNIYISIVYNGNAPA